jgi:hypothetical protein
MAKHVIVESYTFVPGTRTITVNGKNIRREQLLLITNVTSGAVIYNFSDPSLGATSYTTAVNSTTGLETTTIVVAFNTSAMGANDRLSILVEETYNEMIPAEALRDPVDKLRVSTPQALIDTDFEYGMQPTKWESISMLNNRPSAFIDFTQGISNISRNDLSFVGSGNALSNTSAYQITNMTASGRVVTVSINNTQGITVGTPIYVQGTLDDANASGWWLVESVSANSSFTFSCSIAPAASLFDSSKTYVYIAFFYSNAGIPVSIAGGGAFTNSGTIVTGTTTHAHGLRVGDGIYVVGTTASTNPPNGSWIVATTPTNNTFTFIVVNAPTGTITASGVGNVTLFPRPIGYVTHRPFDGGVGFGNLQPFHGYQTIRQTRRQFRYQSGKGMQFSTGTIIKPQLNADNLTSSGTTVTVTTKYPHGLLAGASVIVSGCNETAYNGTFTVVTAPTALTFTYTALTTPSATPATGNPLASINTWFGASNRIGMFDNQNGFYFEFDGQTLFAVRRNSTLQLSGSAAVTASSPTVTGTNTKFSEQLVPGDFIVIRGMSYLVQHILSNTSMTIYPEYRGVTSSNNTVSKTVNTRFAQSTWNIDRCDGTGASLYNLDLTRMQMLYMDYSWYGAGAIRFGFKNNRGEVIYCHRIPNTNVNTEAFMRSGNLVSRYEVNQLPLQTFLTATLSNAATTGATITVRDTTGWPNAGTVVLTQAAATGAAIEYITYSARTLTTLTIASRAQTGGNVSAQTFTVTGASTGSPGGTALIMAELYSPQASSTLSHWGSSVIMDGRYDDDKSLVFNAGSTTALTNLAQNVRQPVLSLRIAPTVDNGLTGLLGQREIINRMQLTLRQMDAFTTGTAFRIDIILNGRLSAGTWAPLGGSSLAQVIYHTGGQTITGGESIFGFFTSNAGAVTQDLSIVRDIGNSILGGGNTLTASSTPFNIYPDGPDVITVCCTNITNVATNSIHSRLSWTEAQA